MRKLILNKETIRSLASVDLSRIHGGFPTQPKRCTDICTGDSPCCTEKYSGCNTGGLDPGSAIGCD